MDRPIFNKYIIALTSIIFILVNINFAGQFIVLEQHPGSLRLQFKIERDLDFQGLDKYPSEPVRINIPGETLEFFSSELLLPVFTENIALPDTLKPQITIVNKKYQEFKLPASFPKNTKQQIEKIEPVQFTEPGYSRLIPAGSIKIIPFEYVAENNTLRLISSITIDLNFRSNRSLDSKNYNSGDSQTTGFLNSKYASEYRQKIKRSLKKEKTYPSGNWIRIRTREKGLYKIGFESISEQIDIEEGIDVDRIALFSNSNSGRKLTSNISAEVPENLIENNIRIEGDEDGAFNSGDSLIFYGQATSGIFFNGYGNIDFDKNQYSDVNYYWLLIADQALSSPKRMKMLQSDNSGSEYNQTTTESYYRYENDDYNILQSGDEWFGKKFQKKGDSKIIIPTIRDINISDNKTLNSMRDIRARIRLAGGTSSGRNNFDIFFNNNQVESEFISNYNRETIYLNHNDLSEHVFQDGGNSFRIVYGNNNSEAYFDYLEMFCHRDLILRNDAFVLIGDKFSGRISYTIKNNSNQTPAIYNITDPANVAIQQYQVKDDQIIFTAENNTQNRQQYYIISNIHYKTPETLENIEVDQWNSIRNQNINADYIILTAEKFREAAEKIADVYENQVPEKDRLKTMITTQDQVLREFNGDVKDPNAIRFFVKYAYENWPTSPSYLLLLGDGTFDHRGLETKYASNNYIMTYQEEESSWRDYQYFPNDAHYTYVYGDDRYMDVAIGRIPARTAGQAMAAANKIQQYLTDPEYGEWRNQITLVADDPNRPHSNEPEHIRDSENSLVRNMPPLFNLSKLYALEFPAEENASSFGVGRPKATEAIIESLNKGTNIITYLGHGSPDHWAQEGLLETNDLGKIQTGKKLPIWLVGTCSWSYYDFLDKFCIPERLVLSENNAAIAAFGGPRPSWATSNASLMRKILKEWFDKNRINRIRIGELIRRKKTGYSNNDEQYTLLGDPAIYPAMPYYTANFEQMEEDTLKSLGRTEVQGNIEEALDNFNGQGILKVFDSEQKVKREDTEGGTMQYILPGNIIFKGRIPIKNGKFTTRFTIPKDLNFGDRPGYFNLYAWNEETGQEIAGYYDSVFYSGSNNISDTIGPEIEFGFTGVDFQNNDIVTPENDIRILLSDENGLNITNQLGHEMTLIFDDNNQKINVTEYFTATSEDSGEIIYPLPEELESGSHSVTIQAWDNANNLSMTTMEFTYSPTTDLRLEKVVNYPNPFSGSTDITFQLTKDARVEVKIYTIRGLMIKKIESQSIFPAGFNKIHWDGKDDFGDNISRGIYLYKISAKSEINDHNDSYIGKMVKE